eukprot:1742059-Amphidinium_carterae.1
MPHARSKLVVYACGHSIVRLHFACLRTLLLFLLLGCVSYHIKHVAWSAMTLNYDFARGACPTAQLTC